MSRYYLGVDLGTTYTAAAVWRDGRVEITNLGNRAAVIPSVVLLRENGSLLVGEAAERRATAEPGRVAREFKRRMGDPTPIIVGGTPYSGDALTARLLRWVVDKVTETEGGPPAGLAVSYPANWGNYKTDLLDQAIARADLDRVATVTEPEAAAIHYASQERVDAGAIVAVYDLGGGTFDAAVLRKTDTAWDILGEPQGIERLGGVDIDEAVFQHVTTSLDGAIERLDPDAPGTLTAVARLRADCVEAKEALSSDTDVSIPVFLPDRQTDVRLTRRELETMIRPALDGSIVALDRALRTAGVDTGDVSAVLLVGGSSRVPLVAQLVGSEVGRPVAIDAHPKYSVALGAAIIAAGRDVADAADQSEVAAIPEPPSLAATTAAAPTPFGMPSPGPAARTPHPNGWAATPGPYGRPPGQAAGTAPATAVAAPAPTSPGPYRPAPARPATAAPGQKRSKAGLVVLGLAVTAVVGLVVVQATLLDGSTSSPPTVPTFPTTTTTVAVSELSLGCRQGSMQDCDQIYERGELDPPSVNTFDREVAETCGQEDPAGGHLGTCEADFGGGSG